MKNLMHRIFFLVLSKPQHLSVIFTVFLLFVSFMPQISFADANDLAGMGANIEDQTKGIAGAAQILFYLLGFILVGVGLIMLAVSKEKGTAVTMLIVGFALTSIGFVVSMGSSSMFGGDQSQTSKLFDN